MSEKEKQLTFKDLLKALKNRPKPYYWSTTHEETLKIFDEWFENLEGLVAKLQKQLREFSKAPVNTNPKLMNWVILNLTCKKGRIVRAEAIRKFIKKRILGDLP